MVVWRNTIYTFNKEGIVEHQHKRNGMAWVLFRNGNLVYFFGLCCEGLDKRDILEDTVTIFKMKGGESLRVGSHHS